MSSLLQNKHQKGLGLFRLQRYLTSEIILYLYKVTMRPCMEYCPHIWGGAPQSGCLDLLDKVQSRQVNFVGLVLSTTLQPHSYRIVVKSLSLLCKYYHGKCSQGLSSLVPHGCLSVRSTRFSESLHQYAVGIQRCKRNFYQTSFFSRTAMFWNSPSAGSFPLEYNLPVKSRINWFLFSLH